MLLTDAYRDQLLELHATTGWGKSADRWAGEVLEWAKSHKARTLLDYGCGKGALSSALVDSGLIVREYDPGIPGKDGAPGEADVVVCLDVLEHIEPEYIDRVLLDLVRLARTGAFAVIALYQGGRRLPDGRHAHLIVEGPAWWERKIRGLYPAGVRVYTDYRPVPGRNPLKQARDCLVVRMEKL
jgi:hypothetical protein